MQHTIHLKLREPTLIQLLRLQQRLGAGSYAEVFRRALDELDRATGPSNGQIRAVEMEGEDV